MGVNNCYGKIRILSCGKHSTRNDSTNTMAMTMTMASSSIDDIQKQTESSYTKEFSMLLEDTESWSEKMMAPAEFNTNPQWRNNPFAGVAINDRAFWSSCWKTMVL